MMGKNITDVLLQEKDLPRVFKFVELRQVDNVTAARMRTNPDAALALFGEHGRITGCGATFETSANTLEEEVIGCFVSLYRDTLGAEFFTNNWMADIRGELQDIGKLVSLEEVTIPPIGDKSFGCRAKVRAKTPRGEESLWNVIDICWLRSNVISGLRWVSAENAPFVADAVRLCQIQDKRLGCLIQGSGQQSAMEGLPKVVPTSKEPEITACRSCGKKELPPDARFCPACGNKVEIKNPGKTCSICGTRMPEEARFCGKCGTRL
jgi:hypothetical protein